MARLGKEHLGDMSDEGTRVRQRRERLGMDKQDLANEAGVNRNTLAAIERGDSFNRTTLAKIERALDRLEEEAGINAPAPAAESNPMGDLIEFDISGDFGVHVIVKGPVHDAELLQRQVIGIIREIRATEKDDSAGR